MDDPTRLLFLSAVLAFSASSVSHPHHMAPSECYQCQGCDRAILPRPRFRFRFVDHPYLHCGVVVVPGTRHIFFFYSSRVGGRNALFFVASAPPGASFQHLAVGFGLYLSALWLEYHYYSFSFPPKRGDFDSWLGPEGILKKK